MAVPDPAADLRAAYAAQRELGPDYDDVLLDSFLERAETELRQRMGAEEPAYRPRPASPAATERADGVHVTVGPGGITLILVNVVWGVLATLLASTPDPTRLPGLSALWIVLGLADASYVGVLAAGGDRSRRHDGRADPPRRMRPGTGAPRAGS